MGGVRHRLVVAVALAACVPPARDGDEHGDPAESDSTGADPSESAGDSAGASSDETTSGAEDAGDCSCCSTSLRVHWEDRASYELTMTSASFGSFLVLCPSGFIDGHPSFHATCAPGEAILTSDRPVEAFVEELWSVRFDSEHADEQQSECDDGPSCDCNCVAAPCELFVNPLAEG